MSQSPNNLPGHISDGSSFSSVMYVPCVSQGTPVYPPWYRTVVVERKGFTSADVAVWLCIASVALSAFAAFFVKSVCAG